MTRSRARQIELIKQGKSLSVANKPAAEDRIAMKARIVTMEALYHLDGRDDRNHPHHHRYTGLWALNL